MDGYALDQLGDHLRGFGADGLVVQRGPQVVDLRFKTLQQYRMRQDVSRRRRLCLYGKLRLEPGLLGLAFGEKTQKRRAEYAAYTKTR